MSPEDRPWDVPTTHSADASRNGTSGLEELVNRRLVLSGDRLPHHGLHEGSSKRFNGDGLSG
jgi:hypothetical protein